MSSDTDRPRQRTVAELLAEHGNGGATGRRRRRRAADDEPDAGGYDGRSADVAAPAPPAVRRSVPERALLPEQVPQQSRFSPETSRNPVAPPPAFPERTRPDPRRERSTDVMPRIHTAAPVVDESLTGPLPPPQAPAAGPTDTAAPETEALAISTDTDDAGPSTMVGAAPVEAQEWHRARTADARRGGTAIDGGPPLQSAPADVVPTQYMAEPDTAEPQEAEPDAPVDLHKPDDHKHDDHKHDDGLAEAPPQPRERRLGRASAAAKEAAAPGWAAVLGQWIAGALGGAVLWVLFRFLWRSLPVVAFASAALVTVGLVVIVRALLHNNDRRTTVFAVLVGLLLTVSPALLVLLGR